MLLRYRTLLMRQFAPKPAKRYFAVAAEDNYSYDTKYQIQYHFDKEWRTTKFNKGVFGLVGSIIE